MADFNWLNALAARKWSAPDRGWSVLSMDAREFAQRSGLKPGEALESLFPEWAARQLHRNYSLLPDEVGDQAGHVVIGMRANPVLAKAKSSRTPGERRTAGRSSGNASDA